MNYSELTLDPRLDNAIKKLNYVEMTPIQEQTIPQILLSKDVAGLAQTGTGKTAAFLVPLIERILKTQTDPTSDKAFKDWNNRSFVLVLVPTRELADQINENIIKIADGSGLKSFPLYGGTGYEKQKEALASGLQFVVSTPGRLIDLYKENFVDLKQVRAIVFDEADRMFDMGFKDDMKYILGRVPRDRQFLVFSATLNFDVLNTAYQFGAEPVEINISRDQAKADHVKDFIMHLGHDEKPQFLLSLLKTENPKQAMIFTNFKHNVDRVAYFLMNNGIPAMGISSLMSQAQRNQVIEKFKADNDQNILVATDVAARGLDINGVDMVVNYEMPQDAESYVHRIGRTGRAGREGKAFSLICDRDIDSLARVEEYTKKKIDAFFLEDANLVKDFKPLSNHEETGFKPHFDKNNKFNKRDDRKPKFAKKPLEAKGESKIKPATTQPQAQKNFKTEKRFDKKPLDRKNDKKPFDKNRKVTIIPAAQVASATKTKTKSFRNNKSNEKKPTSSVGQKVKSFLKKIFG